jgi:hypothetical protein
MGQVDQSHGQGAGLPLDVCVHREVCSIGVRGNGAVAIGTQQSHAVLLEALDTLSEGCPNRFASPTETAAMRGATSGDPLHSRNRRWELTLGEAARSLRRGCARCCRKNIGSSRGRPHQRSGSIVSRRPAAVRRETWSAGAEARSMHVASTPREVLVTGANIHAEVRCSCHSKIPETRFANAAKAIHRQSAPCHRVASPMPAANAAASHNTVSFRGAGGGLPPSPCEMSGEKDRTDGRLKCRSRILRTRRDRVPA